VALAGCSATRPFLPSSGPTTDQVLEQTAPKQDVGIQVVDLTGGVLRSIVATQKRRTFADAFGSTAAPALTIGRGDSVEVSVWEAPPAALFGNGVPEQPGINSTSRGTVFPEQLVSSMGTITVPFAGTIQAAGRTPHEVQDEIVSRLARLANRPQAFVRVIRNVSSTVAVVGEVTTSARQPLSPYGERLLDVLAASAGFRQPVGKITIQITRMVAENGQRVPRVASVPLETVISDPGQNILLQPGDVVTALFLTNSFTALGAVSRNEEINFEAGGISLAEALGRAGGLRDERANATGVFVFRFEDAAALGDSATGVRTEDGRIPVVYRLDMKDPAAFFLSQGFPVRNKDIIYVANAPGAELAKFVSLLSNLIVPAVTIHNLGF
jgi:polysaccharide biosynthesis/export protein